MTTELAERKRLTFAQAEGVESLPSQLQTKEISQQLRSLLWNIFYNYISFEKEGLYLSSLWQTILSDKHVYFDHLMIDEFSQSFHTWRDKIKNLIANGNYIQIFDFIQFVLRHRRCPSKLSNRVNSALEKAQAAYRVIEDNTIMPISSEAELETLNKAFVDLKSIEFNGARGHLSKAGEALTSGDYAASVRESISAVESVAKMLSPDGDFSKALKKMEESFYIHRSLKEGFNKIYGYTSDEKGIRHSLLDESQAKVDETDAIFMIGACASFVSYMINKARITGIINK